MISLVLIRLEQQVIILQLFQCCFVTVRSRGRSLSRRSVLFHFPPRNDEPHAARACCRPSPRLRLIMCPTPPGIIWQPSESFVPGYFTTSSSLTSSFTSEVLPGCTAWVINRRKHYFSLIVVEVASAVVGGTFFIYFLLVLM